ncbi:hypothetical protein ABZ865_16625 [Streptomyces sp. NPDC047085]|uniref:hypothetical protein n=1 Tax=Streptomyces sp. NPDC047085 TaxID=3155140 RepID=UPI0033EB63BE
MRKLRPLTTAALVLVLATTAVACGDDAGTGQGGGNGTASGAPSGAVGDPGADGNGKAAVAGLAKVADMNGVAKLVSSATGCEGLSRDKEDVLANIDGEGDSNGAAAKIAATDKAFSIKDRATCSGDISNEEYHKLMLVNDMTAFQTAYKNYQRSEGDTDTRYYVGQNFAVELNARSSDREALVRAGTLGINCSPNFVPPAGFRSEPALVDGCVLTDYVH